MKKCNTCESGFDLPGSCIFFPVGVGASSDDFGCIYWGKGGDKVAKKTKKEEKMPMKGKMKKMC